MSLSLGSSFGRYRVEEIAGYGASSIVYRAVDTQTGHAVALKCVREELLVPAEREATLGRFRREAEVGERLVHPGIVRALEHGEQQGLPYLAMEYVGGENLDVLLRGSGPLPLAELGPIVAGVLDALAYAHGLGIVHRDVKPANILLRSAQADPVLTDFGIARTRSSQMTGAGEWLGSPAFMAPEQIRGGAIDHRVDLFASGILLYLGATGRQPFDGSTIAEVMYQVCYVDPPPPSRLDPRLSSLDPVVAAALAKEPGQRYASAAEFRDALARASGAARLAERTVSVVARRRSEGGDDPTPAPSPGGRAPATDGRDDAPTVTELSRRLGERLPSPGRQAELEDWLAGARQLGMLLPAVRVGPAAAEGKAARADLVRRVVAEMLVRSSRITGRLFADEAPDAAGFAVDLAVLDGIADGLGLVQAGDERRLVRAFADVLAGQVLRRAAAVMEVYAQSRDPVARFDVVAMLVHAEALGGLVGRLVDLAAGRPDADRDPVLGFTYESLSVFLDGIGALIAVSEHDLTKAMAARDAGDVGEFVRDLKQVRLVYRFVKRLENDLFRDRLADLSRRIYALFSTLSATVATSAVASPAVQEQTTALYEMAQDLGWHELAGRLLAPLRRSALAVDATLRAPRQAPR